MHRPSAMAKAPDCADLQYKSGRAGPGAPGSACSLTAIFVAIRRAYPLATAVAVTVPAFAMPAIPGPVVTPRRVIAVVIVLVRVTIRPIAGIIVLGMSSCCYHAQRKTCCGTCESAGCDHMIAPKYGRRSDSAKSHHKGRVRPKRQTVAPPLTPS